MWLLRYIIWICARLKQSNWPILNLLALFWLEASRASVGTNCLWLIEAYFCFTVESLLFCSQPWTSARWVRDCGARRAERSRWFVEMAAVARRYSCPDAWGTETGERGDVRQKKKKNTSSESRRGVSGWKVTNRGGTASDRVTGRKLKVLKASVWEQVMREL